MARSTERPSALTQPASGELRNERPNLVERERLCEDAPWEFAGRHVSGQENESGTLLVREPFTKLSPIAVGEVQIAQNQIETVESQRRLGLGDVGRAENAVLAKGAGQAPADQRLVVDYKDPHASKIGQGAISLRPRVILVG